MPSCSLLDGSTGLQPPPVAAPVDSTGQQGAYLGERDGLDLGASMNSGVTTTTTDEDDESQEGGAPPGHDYFGVNAQPVSVRGQVRHHLLTQHVCLHPCTQGH